MKIEDAFKSSASLWGKVQSMIGLTSKSEIQENVDKLMCEILDLVNSTKKALEDKPLNLDEVMGLLTDTCDMIAASKFMKQVESIDDKVSFTIDIMKTVYYNEEYLDNPDIPFLPEFIEGKLELIIFDNVLPGVIKSIITKIVKMNE